MNIATNPVPGPLRRRVRGTRFVAVASLAVLLSSGCVVSEVTHTQNGETVTESVSEAPNTEDIDPCGLDETFLVGLSLDPADLVRGRGASSSPTCT